MYIGSHVTWVETLDIHGRKMLPHGAQHIICAMIEPVMIGATTVSWYANGDLQDEPNS
jgi:hypothetical protein